MKDGITRLVIMVTALSIDEGANPIMGANYEQNKKLVGFMVLWNANSADIMKWHSNDVV